MSTVSSASGALCVSSHGCLDHDENEEERSFSDDADGAFGWLHPSVNTSQKRRQSNDQTFNATIAKRRPDFRIQWGPKNPMYLRGPSLSNRCGACALNRSSSFSSAECCVMCEEHSTLDHWRLAHGVYSHSRSAFTNDDPHPHGCCGSSSPFVQSVALPLCHGCCANAVRGSKRWDQRGVQAEDCGEAGSQGG